MSPEPNAPIVKPVAGYSVDTSVTIGVRGLLFGGVVKKEGPKKKGSE